MKNFPDQDQFDELEKRLQSYSEQPDDLVWENIDAALRPHRTLNWIPWVDFLASAVFIFVVVVAIHKGQSDPAISNSDKGKEQRLATPQTKILKQNRPMKKNANNEQQASPLFDPTGAKKSFPSGTNSQAASLVVNRPVTVTPVAIMPHASSQSVVQDEVSLKTTRLDTLGLLPDEVPRDSIIQSQQTIKQTKRIPKRRPAFYTTLTPSFSFQRAIPLGSDQVIVNELSHASILSVERFGISLDVGVQGFISKRLEYYGGLSFYQQNQTLKYSFQSGNQVIVESSGDNSYIVTPKSSTGLIDYEMLNLGIQAGVLYNLYGRRLTHKIGAGFGYQHGLKKANSESYKNSESSYFSYQVFYRNEVRVSSRIRLFVQPVFMQSIRVREELNAPFNLKPYRAGIGFGILYDF